MAHSLFYYLCPRFAPVLRKTRVYSPGLLIVPVADEICAGRFSYIGSAFTAAVGPIRLYAES